MKKIIFFFTLVLATAMIYSSKQSRQNEMAEKDLKEAIPNDFKGIYKPEMSESNADREYVTPKKALENRSGILLILIDDNNRVAGSTSFLWNLLYANSGQTGC